MRFTDIFLRRPVLAIVVNLVIIISGLQAVRSLNVRQYPKLESATITVTTVYIGASADLYARIKRLDEGVVSEEPAQSPARALMGRLERGLGGQA